MARTLRRTWAAVLLVAATAAGANGPEAPAPSLDALHGSLDQALQKIRADDLEGGRRLLTGALESPLFGELDAGLQRYVFYIAGLVELDLGAPRTAHGLLQRATSLPGATSEDWHARLHAAYKLQDHRDSLYTLATIAREWPDTLAKVSDRAITRIAFESKRDTDADARFAAFDALYTAGWRIDTLHEPSHMWRELSLMLVEAGQPHRAALVAARVQDPYVLIGMRVDRRFASLVSGNRRHYDARRAAEREVRRLRAAAAAQPRSLELIVQLTYAQLAAAQYQEVLRLADRVLERAHAASGGQPPYDDLDAQLIWVMDNRSRALEGLGRWEEAAGQLAIAARMSEDGEPNVSQAINLAYLYTRLGRPAEALAAVQVVGSMSPYGRMQLESVRAIAAAQLEDAETLASALEYLRAHRDDAAGTVEFVLLATGQLEEAAAMLVERLADPVRRLEALVEIQDYSEGPATPVMLEWRERWLAVRDRAEVRQAIERVGRRERFAIAAPPT